MKFILLGSGGTIPIPKPLCFCSICEQARNKGYPYKRCGPCLFVADINLLVDTPPLICESLNNARIKDIDYISYTHLDADHFDGNSALISFYFNGTTFCYEPEKTITLAIPEGVNERLRKVTSQYGSLIDFYENSKVVKTETFSQMKIKNITIHCIKVLENEANAYLFLFVDNKGKKVLYAPCDIKPFPFHSDLVYDCDLLIIQPGFFETGLKDDFRYPVKDRTREELYSFKQTLDIAKRIRAKKIVFTHLEEYWNRSYDDYKKLETENIKFGFDNMIFNV